MKIYLTTLFAIVLLSSVLLSGCTVPRTPTPTVETSADLQAIQQELDAQRKLWAEQRATDYVYTLRIGCFCRPELTQPVSVEVRDGKPLPVRYADGGAPSDPAWFEPYDTVEELFAFVQDAIDRGAAKIDAQYDARMGVPIHVSADYNTAIADEERAIDVSGFGITK